jgi:hypothetical protein
MGRGERMPRYYFAAEGTSWLPDSDGAELPDDETALEHALQMIRELIQSGDDFSGWRMHITRGERIVGEIAFDLKVGGKTWSCAGETLAVLLGAGCPRRTICSRSLLANKTSNMLIAAKPNRSWSAIQGRMHVLGLTKGTARGRPAGPCGKAEA